MMPLAERMKCLLGACVVIVGCYSCSGSGTSPETPEPVYADLILSNGKIYAGVTDQSLADSIAIRRRNILSVGDAEAVGKWRGPETLVLDLRGRIVVPGFHDAHVHLYSGALSALGPDLLTAPTLPLVVSRVEEYARSHPDMEWILGAGWYFDIMPGGRQPSKEDLDTVLPDRPVLLMHISGHYGWVNSEALSRAGIDAETPDPQGGSIGRDPVTGEPNGLLFETASGLVYGTALAGIDPEIKTQALLAQVKELGRMGVTSVDEILVTPGSKEVDLTGYLTLKEQAELTCRVNIFLSGELDPDEILGWKERLSGYDIRLAGLKVFVDGNFQAHTAWLLEPYADRPDTSGLPIFSQEELDAIAKKGQCMGLPVKFHAIGDAAVRSALDAIEAARSSCPAMDSSHSVEHVELLDPGDLQRFASLDTVASVQPLTALFSTIPVVSAVISEVGPDRSRYLFSNRMLKEAGATVLFGTDWPAGPFLDPMIGIWTSMVRTGETDPEQGLPPAPQAFGIEEALAAYTLLPAQALGIEDVLGTIEEGKFADLAVLSQDILAIPKERLVSDVQVDLTVMDGKIVFLREGTWPEMAQGRTSLRLFRPEI